MAMYRGRVEAFHDDQLVVAVPDLREVTQALADLGVRWGPIDASKALGLALIRDLDGVGPAAARLAHDPDTGAEIERFRAERSAARPGTRDVADLELLIKGIRAQLTRRFPGWEVTIGKNYGPSMVKGHPHIDGGGDGDPQPTSAVPRASTEVRVAVPPTARPGTSRAARHPLVPSQQPERALHRRSR